MDQSEGSENEQEIEHSPLTYQIGKTLKLPQLREKMRIRGMSDKGRKQTVLNRLKYFTSSRFQPQGEEKEIHARDGDDPLPNAETDDSDRIDYSDKLPDDVLGHILQFDIQRRDTKLVSKRWERVWNSKGTHRKWEEIRTEHAKKAAKIWFQPSMHITFEKGNNTWVIDAHRTELTPDEKDNGYLGPFQRIRDIAEKIEQNDRIHLYPGDHIIDAFESSGFSKLHIKGMGDHVSDVTVRSSPFHVGYWKELYFENITFDLKYQDMHGDNHSMGTFLKYYIRAESLWMKDCLIKSDGGCGIFGDPGTYGFYGCKFVGCSDGIRIRTELISPIWNSPITHISVIGCEFGNCGKQIVDDGITAEHGGCVVIDLGQLLFGVDVNELETKNCLIAIWNRFTDNLCLPMVEYHRDKRTPGLLLKRDCIYSSNILMGYNAAAVRRKEISDANKAYVIKGNGTTVLHINDDTF